MRLTRQSQPTSESAMRCLFDQFDQVKIINLPERTDRKAAVLAELSRIGFDEFGPRISFFEARRPPSPEQAPSGAARPNGALISHREAIREALAAGANSLLVLEDDIFFRSPTVAELDRILEAVTRNAWDVIYFGYLEPAENQLAGAALSEWSGRVIGGHFCGMNRRFMEQILEFMDGFGSPGADGVIVNPTHRDGAFNLFIEKNPDFRRLLAVPNLAIQRSSRTDLHQNRFYDQTPVFREIAGTIRAMRNRLRRR